MTGYLELLLKENFSRASEGEQPDSKRPRIDDKGLSLKGQCDVYEAMQVSLFNCVINISCCIMSCNVTNHAMHLIGLL